MKYIVKTITATINTTAEHLAKQGIYIATHEANLAFMLTKLLGGLEPLQLITDPEVKQMLGIEMQEEKIFSARTPIQNRRAAIEYIQDLGYNYVSGGQFYTPLTMQQQPGIYRFFSGFVCAEINGESKVIAREVDADIPMLKNWIEELREYEKNSYDIGGTTPFVTTSPFYGDVIKVLPDIASQWHKQETIYN